MQGYQGPYNNRRHSEAPRWWERRGGLHYASHPHMPGGRQVNLPVKRPHSKPPRWRGRREGRRHAAHASHPHAWWWGRDGPRGRGYAARGRGRGRHTTRGCGRGHRQATGQAGRRGQVAAALSHPCCLFVCCRQHETGSRVERSVSGAESHLAGVCEACVSCTGGVRSCTAASIIDLHAHRHQMGMANCMHMPPKTLVRVKN